MNPVHRNSLGRRLGVKFVRMNMLITEESVQDHLARAHPSKQRPSEDLNAYLSKAKFPEGRAKRIMEHITDMVVCDLCSTAMVEGIGFRTLMNHVEPEYHCYAWQEGSLQMDRLPSKVTFKQSWNSLLLQRKTIHLGT